MEENVKSNAQSEHCARNASPINYRAALDPLAFTVFPSLSPAVDGAGLFPVR